MNVSCKNSYRFGSNVRPQAAYCASERQAGPVALLTPTHTSCSLPSKTPGVFPKGVLHDSQKKVDCSRQSPADGVHQAEPPAYLMPIDRVLRSGSCRMISTSGVFKSS